VADHVTPWVPTSFVTVTLKLSACPTVSPPRFGVSVRVSAGSGTIVIVADADFVGSVTDVACSSKLADGGISGGAVYVIGVPEALAFADISPHNPSLHSELSSFQVTPLFAGSLVTVAVNACISPTGTFAVLGFTVTVIGAAAVVTVIVAVPDFVPSVTEVAVSVTVAGVGALAGAV
jgi:hypothetical protein